MRVLELILMLLALAAVLDLIAQRFLIPLPALLVLGGLVLALVPGLPDVELNPDVVFLVFVPPLLYWAALTTSLRDLRENLRSIALLGVGLVLVTMAVVAWVAHEMIPGMTWGAAFVLGAIVSPPDAVAVTAVTRRLGVPKVIITILEGESLVNDATALVAYRMAVAAVVTGTFSLSEAGIRFIWTGAGGILLGLVIGWMIGWIRQWIGQAPAVENTISLLTPFAIFIPAERLGLASVLAGVAAGLYLGRKGPRIISAETRLQGGAMWGILTFLLEGLIFIIIGLELPVVRRAIAGYPLSRLALYAGVLSVVLIIVRIAWVFPGANLPRFIRRRFFGKPETYPPWRHLLFAGWAGMRGADSLVIALALPVTTASGAQFPGRAMIIFLTFAVILVTLGLQGLTLKSVIRLLGLKEDHDGDREETAARLAAVRAGLRRLDELARRGNVTPTMVDQIRRRYEHRAHTLATDGRNVHAETDRRAALAYRKLRREMIDAERAAVVGLRDQEKIGDDVMRRIQEDLDLEEVLLAEDDEEGASNGAPEETGSS